MTTARRPKAPPGLGPRGRALWRDVTGEYEFGRDELELLTELVRTVDEMEALRTVLAAEGPMSTGSAGQVVEHPAGAALRAHRSVLSRLVRQLALPDELAEDEAEERGATSLRFRAASHAARARWGS